MPAARWRPAVAVSAALHAAALVAVLLRPAPAPAAAASVDAIPVALVAPPRPAPVTLDVVPQFSDVFELSLPPADPPPPSTPAEGATEGPPADCRLPDTVRAALQAEAPRAALARIPEGRRSVAGAVMLWDGRWVRDGALAASSIAGPIRRAVVDAVRAADPACAAAAVAGPVVLVVPDPAGSLVLVLGSGTWRWADLVIAG